MHAMNRPQGGIRSLVIQLRPVVPDEVWFHRTFVIQTRKSTPNLTSRGVAKGSANHGGWCPISKWFDGGGGGEQTWGQWMEGQLRIRPTKQVLKALMTNHRSLGDQPSMVEAGLLQGWCPSNVGGWSHMRRYRHRHTYNTHTHAHAHLFRNF